MIPSRKACEELWEEKSLPDDLKNHLTAVAGLAVQIGNALNREGLSLNIPLIEAAALLHDIEKGKPHHAEAGADMLAKAGFCEAAPIVRAHMRLEPGAQLQITELTVVFLADKMMIGSKAVCIEKRYGDKLLIYRDQPVITRNIAKQYEAARSLERIIKEYLGADSLLNLS